MTARFPILEQYLATLPSGLESYPDCTVKAGLFRDVLCGMPPRDELRELPPVLYETLMTPPPVSVWVPEVLFRGITRGVADTYFPGDQAGYLRFVEEANRRLFTSPAYSIMMQLRDPRRIAQYFGDRWAHFHRGTAFELKVEEHTATACLRYPHGLFTEFDVRATARSLAMGLECSGGTGVVVELQELARAQARYSLRWS